MIDGISLKEFNLACQLISYTYEKPVHWLISNALLDLHKAFNCVQALDPISMKMWHEWIIVRMSQYVLVICKTFAIEGINSSKSLDCCCVSWFKGTVLILKSPQVTETPEHWSHCKYVHSSTNACRFGLRSRVSTRS